MITVILGYYLGLLVFAFNGLQLVALNNKARELAAKEEDIKRLLIRAKLRR